MGYWILIGFLVLVGWLIIDDIYSKIEKLRKEVFFLQGKLSEKTILSSQHVDLLHIDPVDDLGTQDEEGSLFVSDAVSVVDDYNEGEQHIQGEEVISTERGFFSKFIDWFSIDWPMKVGGLLFILGVGWFIVYAIQNNWISPVVRVLLSLVVSFIMIGLGCYHIQKQPLQGFYLIGLGSSVYVVSIYLALKVFAFFGANIGLALVALQYIWMIYLSYRYKNSWLSTVGLFFAMITPFLFSTGTGNLLGLFAYLAIHLVGSMSIGLVNDRNLSRLMNVVYLLLYLMIGYVMYPNLIFSWGVFGIIVSLFLLVSGVELYQGVYKKLERTSPQYATLIASGFGLFFYLSLTNIYGGVVGGLFLLIALGYGLLWYREQSSASPYVYLVGLSSLLYTIGFAYYSFSGMNLALSMILVVGYAVSVVLYVTKNIKSILVLRYLFLLPLTLLLFFSSDAISSSQGLYYSSLVVFVGIMMGLSISSYQVLKHKPLTVFFAISGVVLLYYLIGVAFDDYLRIFLLTVVSGLIVVVGHILRFDKKDYTYYSLVSCILPALYILQYAFVINLSLFVL